jgi:hypothetical protein
MIVSLAPSYKCPRWTTEAKCEMRLRRRPAPYPHPSTVTTSLSYFIISPSSIVHCPSSMFSTLLLLLPALCHVTSLSPSCCLCLPPDASSTPTSSSFSSSLAHSPMPRYVHHPLTLYDVLFSRQPPSRPTISTEQRLPPPPLHTPVPVVVQAGSEA